MCVVQIFQASFRRPLLSKKSDLLWYDSSYFQRVWRFALQQEEQKRKEEERKKTDEAEVRMLSQVRFGLQWPLCSLQHLFAFRDRLKSADVFCFRTTRNRCRPVISTPSLKVFSTAACSSSINCQTQFTGKRFG